MSLLYIDLKRQQVQLQTQHNGPVLAQYPISSGCNGPNQQAGSHGTPLGWHVIKARIGAGCALNSVFVGRRFTGEIYNAELAARFPQRDWILSRILWLGGLEPGMNRYGTVDTLRRYIYLHGTPDSEPMGIPASHGCIRLRNSDIVQLFEQVTVGTRVLIARGSA